MARPSSLMAQESLSLIGSEDTQQAELLHQVFGDRCETAGFKKMGATERRAGGCDQAINHPAATAPVWPAKVEPG